MGFGPLSLLKRFGSFQTSDDADSYPPSLSVLIRSDDEDTGGADPNSDLSRPKDGELPQTKGAVSNPQATHNPPGGPDRMGNNEPGEAPGSHPHRPGEEDNPVLGDGFGHTTAVVETTKAAAPTHIGNKPYSNPQIDPVATKTAPSSEEPTDTDSGLAASGGSGSGADGKKVAAIAVPVVVVCVALIVGLFFFLWRRRKRHAVQASAYHDETTNPGMTQNTHANTPPTLLVQQPQPLPPPPPQPPGANTIPLMTPEEPPQNLNDDSNQRLSAISVQLQRAQQQPAVVAARPKSHVKRDSAPQQGSTALTEENLATLGDTPQGYSYQRPRSPFDHPDDDIVSAISGLSPGGNDPRHQGREVDEVSAISSLEHTEMPPRRLQ